MEHELFLGTAAPARWREVVAAVPSITVGSQTDSVPEQEPALGADGGRRWMKDESQPLKLKAPLPVSVNDREYIKRPSIGTSPRVGEGPLQG